ncbi:MAG: 4Fe-4S binding protein [Muribaculaceae bacterium]
MKGLRTIRIVLSVMFFAAAIAYLAFGVATFHVGRIVERSQVVPSAIAATMGATLFWIIVSFLLGRVYCSTVCPVGTFQDIVIRLRRRLPKSSKPFSYKPARQTRYHVLAVYIVCFVAGVLAVPFWLEPWNIMKNICAAINPSLLEATWMTLGIGMGAGIASGIISAVLIAICALFTGRGFCTDICPIGTALGCFHDFTLMHIEIDPDKCVNCMKCEEICKSQCVKVVGRYVDNSRCVRCFDCVAVCPNDAIRFQANRNRRGTPLIRKVGRSKI